MSQPASSSWTPQRFSVAFLVLSGTAVVGLLGVLVWVIRGVGRLGSPVDKIPGLREQVEQLDAADRAVVAIAEWFVANLDSYVSVAVTVAILLGICVVGLLGFLAVQMYRSDEISVWGISMRTSDELRQARERLAAQDAALAGFRANTNELARIHQQLNYFMRCPPDVTEQAFFELIDEAVRAADFMIRPGLRSTRVSIWLHKRSAGEMRIVAGHRVSGRTMRELVLRDGMNPPGFAWTVMDQRRPLALDLAAREDDRVTWVHDPNSTHETTSIIGQAIEVGDTDDDWAAVLCVSTDTPDGDYALSVVRDGPQLEFFANLVSTLVTLGMGVEVELESAGPRPGDGVRAMEGIESVEHRRPDPRRTLVDELWTRYRRTP